MSSEQIAGGPNVFPLFRLGDYVDCDSLVSCDFEQLSSERAGKEEYIVVSDGSFKYCFMKNGSGHVGKG